MRAAFNRQPGAASQADFLFREIERRMLERLELIRLQPVNRVLDVGCGSGYSLARLAVRFPGAQMIGADLADRALAASVGRPDRQARFGESARRWLTRLGAGNDRQLPATMPLWMATDAQALAVADNAIDLVWSNLVAHWFDDPLAAVAEWHRVVRPGGLLMFSAFGVDTLKEVRPLQRRAAAGVAGASNAAEAAAATEATHAADASDWPTYQDMHDWGDALSAAGFADPVMDAERLTLTYEDPGRFWSDAQSLSMQRGLEGQSAAPEPLALSIEVIYGHAWCPDVKRRRDGLDTVRFYPGSKL